MTDHSIKSAGIDTSKKTLDVALAGRPATLQVANDATGHRSLATWLADNGVERVGIEATGGYERSVVARLRAEGFTAIVFQPIQVRAYATYRLQRAKNDRIDAALIAACTADKETIRAAPDPRLEALAEPLTLLEQIEDDIARNKTRLEAFREPRTRDMVKAEIERLKARRKAEIKRLIAEARRHHDLARRFDLIDSVPGIGERTALALLVRMPELGTLTREQAAALAGLAPYDNDSGKRQGQRSIAGGRKRLRKSLYAAALPAAFQWNPALIALYRRLTQAGKPHKPALVACARKLVIYANTVVARGTPWINSDQTI